MTDRVPKTIRRAPGTVVHDPMMARRVPKTADRTLKTMIVLGA